MNTHESAVAEVVESVRWAPDRAAVRIIDQRELPAAFVERDLQSLDDFVDAIQTLSVRGAPAIGITAAMGLALLAAKLQTEDFSAFTRRIEALAGRLRSARPTAVNLAWAVDRVLARGLAANGSRESAELMLQEADAIRDEDRAMCRRIGEFGSQLIEDGMAVLTHCNTGALATGGIGTALGAIYVAHEQGKKIRVFASETRPLLQGSRLTAWELSRAGIPVTVVAEGAVASLMRDGRIGCCIVGADRITRRGDVVNKIGTLSHAVLARAFKVPFYVAAPTSTIDGDTASGAHVAIEERSKVELLGGTETPSGLDAFNPAFDVTPADYVTAIVTDAAVVRPPYSFLPRIPHG